MKKTTLLIVAIVSVFLLSGCTKKTSTGSTTTSNQAASAPDTLNNAATSSSTSATATTSTTSSSQVDTAALDQTFQTNYTEALQTANSSLQNKAKFCSAQIEYVPSTATNSKQTFYFTADISGIKDYYWVVVFDPYSSINKKRMLVARKDVADDIICQSTAGATVPGYVSAITTIQASGATLPNSENIAKTLISLKDTAWNVVIWGKNGQMLLAQQVPISNAAATTNSQ